METKKLTAKDLMIGDWVEVNGKFIQVENVHKDMINYTPDIPYVQEEDFIEGKDITPTPLTAEVLEKNGFYFGYTSQQEDAASQIGCSCEKAWTYDEGGGSIQVTFPNECDGGLIVLDDQDFDKNLEFVFANQIYVHELQHALRLCGVEKNIII